MANEKIEVDIVLNDGSIAKGFANIQREAKKTESFLNGVFQVFGGVQLANAFNKATDSIAGFFDLAVKEAIDGEAAFNNLATSLQTAGDYSVDAFNNFKDLGDELQNTSKFSGSAVVNASALARGLTRTNAEAEKLVRTAVELSAKTGNDLNTSVEQLGATLSGTAGRLGKVIPELRGLTEASLKSGDAIDIVLKRLAGTAESQLTTFSGRLAKARNDFNSFAEEFGKAFVNSPAVLAVFEQIGLVFQQISTAALSFNKTGDDVFKNIILNAASVAKALNFFILKPFEIIINLTKLAYDNVKLLFDFFIAGLGKIAGAVGALTKFFNKESNLAESLLTFSDSSGDVFVKQMGKVANNAANFFDKAFDQSGTTAIDSFLNNVENAVNSTSGKLNKVTDQARVNLAQGPNIDFRAMEEEAKKFTELQKKVLDLRFEIQSSADSLNIVDLQEQLSTIPDALDIATASTLQALETQQAALQSFKDNTVAAARQVNEAITTGITNAISNGIQAAVTALVNGQDAFKAFASAILNTFGDLAIQLGTFFIAQGIAALALKFLDPTGTIAAGAGLVALGAVMKAFFGSQGKSATAGGGSSLTPPLTPATPVSGISDNVNNPAQAVNVVIEGNVFDSDATGLRIATILKEQGYANAVIS